MGVTIGSQATLYFHISYIEAKKALGVKSKKKKYLKV